MGGKDDRPEEENGGVDNLLDLSLNDLSPEDIDNEFSGDRADKEIIELVDLVEKGNKGMEESEAEDTITYEDDVPTKALGEDTGDAGEIPHSGESVDKDVVFSETDLELANISLESDLSMFGKDEEDTGTGAESYSEDEIAHMLAEETESDMAQTIERALESGELPDDTNKKSNMPEPAGEMDMTIRGPIPSREAAEESKEASREAPGPQISDALSRDAAKDEGMHLISEKKIEVIVKRVVEDVVERVARETMAEVAERVIRETIDALKSSLEKEPE
jgi:hypothetical protein